LFADTDMNRAEQYVRGAISSGEKMKKN